MKKLFIILLFLSLCLPAYSANEWKNLSADYLDGDAVDFNDIDTELNDHTLEPLERMLTKYQEGMEIVYSSASQVTVTAGEVMCSNTAGTLRKMRKNTSSTTVTWADIDTGAEASSTTYWVYANCDADATTATFKISTSGTAPTGVTYYKRVGGFYNNSSSNIDKTKIYVVPYRATPTDSTGGAIITAIFDYGTSASSYSEKTAGLKVAFGSISSIAVAGSQAITNLPFSSASSYRVAISMQVTGTDYTTGGSAINSSGSSFTLYNNDDNLAQSIDWIAIGI